MVRCCAGVCVVFLLATLAFSQSEQNPSGQWSGRIEIPGQPLEVTVRLRKAEAGFAGDIDIPAQNAKGLALEKILVEGRTVMFAIAGIPGAPIFTGEIADDGKQLAGRFVQGGQRFKFVLRSVAQVSFLGMQSYLDELREKFHVPGCAVAVVKDGAVLATMVSGVRDIERDLPVTPDTLFAIGSSTKAFTTLLLAMLVEDGKLDWDKPVRTFLPEFALSDAEISARITLRDLVTHRSGMPRHDLVWYGATFERALLVQRLRYLPLSKDLRTDFQYNNLMLLAAGYVAEHVTGSSFEAMVRDRIFAPLGMSRSNFEVKVSAADADHAEPYRHSEKKTKQIPFRDITAIGPAGSINSSVREMVAWVALHLGDGKQGERAIVQPSSMRNLHAVVMPMGEDKSAGPLIQNIGYALGWMVDVYRGARRIYHGGNIDGFTALVSFLPEQGYGFVVLTNLDKTPFPELIVRRLCDRVLSLDDHDFATALAGKMEIAEGMSRKGLENANVERVEGTKPSQPIDNYVGSYQHPAYGLCRVERAGEQLKVDLHGIGGVFSHFHYDVFRCEKNDLMPELAGLRVQFRMDVDGDLDALLMVLEPAVKAMVFLRQPDAKMRDLAFLLQLVGSYDLDGQVAKFEVNGTSLTMTMPGQHYVLEPRHALVFGIGELKGYSVRFVLGDDGKAVSVHIRQPEGVFIGKRAPAK
jgi:CubicO group peptidase (beta-lactamase class C family)